MKAGYKISYARLEFDKILVVSNLPGVNEVFILSVENEIVAKNDKDGYDIGFWRIKRK